jgi:hypothetical protein
MDAGKPTRPSGENVTGVQWYNESALQATVEGQADLINDHAGEFARAVREQRDELTREDILDDAIRLRDDLQVIITLLEHYPEEDDE